MVRERAPIRAIMLFAGLLAVLISVPVFAAEPPVPDPDDVQLPRSLEAPSGTPPDAETVRQGLLDAERREAERKRELESPEAAKERARSRSAFADLDAPAAEALLRSEFAAQLQKLNRDPARYLSRADEVRPLGGSAVAVREGSDRALLDTGIPVEAAEEEGARGGVDVGLESTGEGFKTENGLTEVSIGDSAAKPIELTDEQISIAQAGARPSSSTRRYGSQNAFQFESYTDTDTLISPISGGVEISQLLRSEQSPETFEYDLEIPAGAELRGLAGGAVVVKDGERIAVVPRPTAVDAQGTGVPVNLVVQGDSLRLETGHRDRD